MEKCRICLLSKKALFCIFEPNRNENTTYAEMITSLANVTVTQDSGIANKLCRMCCSQLRAAYGFRKLIQRSDTALYKTKNLKKINFNHINDIKMEVEIEQDSKEPMMKIENCKEYFNEYFKDGVNEMCYCNTVIKKVDNDGVNKCKNPMPVLEFLKSIKDEPDIDYNDVYDMDDDQDYIPLHKLWKKERKKRKRNKRKTIIQVSTNKINSISSNNNKKSKQVCIKPKFLTDLKLIYSKGEKTKVNKKKVINAKQEICPYCGKMSTSSLKNHLLQHTGERTFKCDKCGKALFTKGGLSLHMKKHLEYKEFKCDHCVAAFYDKTSLRSHMLSHTTEKKYVCDICSKAFKRTGALHRHALTHNSANKSIMCEQCNMSFFTKYGLRHHMRVHTGERPYNCEICSQPYSYKHDFNRHCLKKHGVFLKRRSVSVMNEVVLKQEKILMRELMLRVHGIVKDDKPLDAFDGPRGAQAFAQAVKALESKQIPINYQL